jgi:hypothetical protein
MYTLRVSFTSFFHCFRFVSRISVLALAVSFFFYSVALLPVLCWALDHVARFLRRNFARSSFYRLVTDSCKLSIQLLSKPVVTDFVFISCLGDTWRSLVCGWRQTTPQLASFVQMLKLPWAFLWLYHFSRMFNRSLLGKLFSEDFFCIYTYIKCHVFFLM